MVGGACVMTILEMCVSLTLYKPKTREKKEQMNESEA